MKILSILSMFLIVALWFLPIGDVNFDGRVNSTDLNIVWVGNLNPIQRIVADVNRDGRVDETDLNLIFDMILRRNT